MGVVRPTIRWSSLLTRRMETDTGWCRTGIDSNQETQVVVDDSSVDDLAHTSGLVRNMLGHLGKNPTPSKRLLTPKVHKSVSIFLMEEGSWDRDQWSDHAKAASWNWVSRVSIVAEMCTEGVAVVRRTGAYPSIVKAPKTMFGDGDVTRSRGPCFE